MPGTTKTISVQAGSELDEILAAATEADVLLERNGVRFRVSRVESLGEESRRAPRRHRLEPERGLNIIGIGASTGMSDIATRKDQSIADAAADRGK